MAHIFAGELARIDPEVLEAVKELPDDFWIFAEFNVGRNVDWFIIRPKSDEPSTLILTELKRSTRPIRGSGDGYWERMAENGEWEELPSNGKDMNYYWQTVNSANALADWLWNYQRLYLERPDVRPADQFRVWPNLLLLSPAGVQHRLPLGPTNKYGRWFYDIPSWLQHVTGWNSRMGIELTEREVANLADALQLERIWGPDASAVPVGATPASSEASQHAAPASAGGELELFIGWLQRIEQRIARLEDRIGLEHEL